QEYVIASFEEIIRFMQEHGRVPVDTEGRDIFERIYARWLARMRADEEVSDLLEPHDRLQLLDAPDGAADASLPTEELDDDALLAELGVSADDDLTRLAHVRPANRPQMPDDVASQRPCEDFERFRPLFERVRKDLEAGVRTTSRFGKDASIHKGDWFILNGQIIHVAEEGEEERRTKSERPDRRLRVIYDNGTESNLLMRSLQRALHKDRAGRRISEPKPGPLFSDMQDDDDVFSGTLYVLRSKSDHPQIRELRDTLHKIGITSGDAEKRIANAAEEPTFLMADVEVVATYQLYNIDRYKLEHLLHRFFDNARLDIEIKDRFGRALKPREWFLVPLDVIDEAVQHLMDGS
ncbi:MAG: GIY-YIG nuclease family protein, partial [Mariprofundaceae bacterium]|nr:GIY-YIG nuclease family protein [Mariprofundaceae bacterium]